MKIIRLTDKDITRKAPVDGLVLTDDDVPYFISVTTCWEPAEIEEKKILSYIQEHFPNYVILDDYWFENQGHGGAHLVQLPLKLLETNLNVEIVHKPGVHGTPKGQPTKVLKIIGNKNSPVYKIKVQLPTKYTPDWLSFNTNLNFLTSGGLYSNKYELFTKSFDFLVQFIRANF